VNSVDPVVKALADLDQPANPMVEFKDALLARLLAELCPVAEARPHRDRPWRVHSLPAVRWRHGHRRRVVVLAAVALVVVVGAASALAVRAYVLDQGIVGLPPLGAAPSAPKKGELVFSSTFAHSFGDPGRFHVAVYADGRLITERVGEHGIIERRLTPEGVELMRAEVISTGLVDDDLHFTGGQGLHFGGHIEFRDANRVVHVTWGDGTGTWRGVPGPDVIKETATPEQASALMRLDARLADLATWLPANAWKDLQTKAFVPSSYSVCYEGGNGVGLPRVLALLPRAAGDLLRAQENKPMPYTNLAGTFPSWCSELTTEEARKLERILDGAGVKSVKDVFGLSYGAPGPQAAATEFSLIFNPNLPEEE
jgi:hypothetical protein